MDILSNEEDSDTIAWMPHGRSFIIYKKKKFAAHVLPKYFKATKFTSFTRKLNRWGFTRVTRGPEVGATSRTRMVCLHQLEMFNSCMILFFPLSSYLTDGKLLSQVVLAG